MSPSPLPTQTPAAAPLARRLSPTGPAHVETSRALPLVSFSVAQRCGALGDPPGKQGTAYLLGRLMRRSAGGRTPEAIDELVDSLGGALSIDTHHSSATLHATVIRRSLGPFVELIEELLARPSLPADELARLQREAAAHLVEARDSDRDLVRRWFTRRLYAGHPYGEPVGGTLASLGAIQPADVAREHHAAWTSGSALFAFSGDLSADEGQAIAQRLRQALPPGEPRNDLCPEPRGVEGRRLVIVDKPERTQTQILIGGLGTHPHDDDHLALHVANTIFGGTFTARLTQEVRAKRGWSYGATSSLPYDRHRRAFSLWTFPKAEDAAPCIRLELELLEAWQREGVTKKELAWAKSYLIRSYAFAMDTAAKRSGQVLDAALYDLPEGYHEHYVERLRAVTLEQANAAIARRISTDHLLVTVVATERAIGDALRTSIDRLASVEVVPYDTDG